MFLLTDCLLFLLIQDLNLFSSFRFRVMFALLTIFVDSNSGVIGFVILILEAIIGILVIPFKYTHPF